MKSPNNKGKHFCQNNLPLDIQNQILGQPYFYKLCIVFLNLLALILASGLLGLLGSILCIYIVFPVRRFDVILNIYSIFFSLAWIYLTTFYGFLKGLYSFILSIFVVIVFVVIDILYLEISGIKINHFYENFIIFPLSIAFVSLLVFSSFILASYSMCINDVLLFSKARKKYTPEILLSLCCATIFSIISAFTDHEEEGADFIYHYWSDLLGLRGVCVIGGILFYFTVIFASLKVAQDKAIQAKYFGFLKSWAIILSTWGSTSFHGLDISHVNFESSILSNVDLRAKTLYRTNFRGAIGLDKARVNNDYLDLSNQKVQRLLTQYDCPSKDLSHLVLRGAYLRNINIKNHNLTDSNLEYSDLYDSNLKDCKLVDSNLLESNLSRADLRNSNLTNANLTKADCHNADLKGCKLVSSNLSEANLSRADLRNSNLTDANLTKADCRNADFYESKLEKVRLLQAKLYDVDLRNSNLIGANLTGSICHRVDFRNAILVRTQLVDVDLSGAYLTGACIEDWNVSSTTNFTDIHCEYIFRRYENGNMTARYPVGRYFEPGEFAALFRTPKNLLEFVFKGDDFNYSALSLAFDKLQTVEPNLNLVLRGIEKREDLWVVTVISNNPTIEKYLDERLNETYQDADFEIALRESILDTYADMKHRLKNSDNEVKRWMGVSENLSQALKNSNQVNSTVVVLGGRITNLVNQGSIQYSEAADHIRSLVMHNHDRASASSEIESFLEVLGKTGSTISEETQINVTKQILIHEMQNNPSFRQSLLEHGSKIIKILPKGTFTNAIQEIITCFSN